MSETTKKSKGFDMISIETPFMCIGISSTVAALLAWNRNGGDKKAWVWVIIAFLLGPLYCIYWLFTEYT